VVEILLRLTSLTAQIAVVKEANPHKETNIHKQTIYYNCTNYMRSPVKAQSYIKSDKTKF